MKNILITGRNSYIGSSLRAYLSENFPNDYSITCISLRTSAWKELDFSPYDVIFHVAGLAHADVDKIDEDGKKAYYRVNADLTEEVAKKSVSSGVKQFIYMSSILVYSGFNGGCITSDTSLVAANFYGDSKIKAEEKLEALDKGDMKICVLRPPMIYGKGSKGNYPSLAKLAGKVPFFPATHNKRSMLYIENLCEFCRLLIENEDEGVFFPQNKGYSDTAELIATIGEVKGKKVAIANWLGFTVKIAKKLPGKLGILANKAFGDLYYDLSMSEYKSDYRIYDLKGSIQRTEG